MVCSGSLDECLGWLHCGFAHPCLDVVRLNPLNSLSDWLVRLAHVVRSVGWLVSLDVGKMLVD